MQESLKRHCQDEENSGSGRHGQADIFFLHRNGDESTPEVSLRVRPRFFDQVGHETMCASSGNKHFFTKSCHRQTYQNYEQSRQKLGTIFENKVS